MGATSQNPAWLPNKQYFKIGEVARLVGVETHTLRYWETEFPQQLKPGKTPSGQRIYRPGEVEQLMKIKTLLYAKGFTIQGARKVLATRGGKDESAKAIVAAASPSATGEGHRVLVERMKAEMAGLKALLAKPENAVPAIPVQKETDPAKQFVQVLRERAGGGSYQSSRLSNPSLFPAPQLSFGGLSSAGASSAGVSQAGVPVPQAAPVRRAK